MALFTTVHFGVLSFLQLSNKRRVTVQDFRGKTLVSIREYYEKEGKQLPTSKGILLLVVSVSLL